MHYISRVMIGMPATKVSKALLRILIAANGVSLTAWRSVESCPTARRLCNQRRQESGLGPSLLAGHSSPACAREVRVGAGLFLVAAYLTDRFPYLAELKPHHVGRKLLQFQPLSSSEILILQCS